MNRKLPKFSKVKPALGGDFKTGHLIHANMYLFQNPLFEEYLSNYFEGTQKPLNEYITLDQFLTIKWKAGVP